MGEHVVRISVWVALFCYPAGPVGLALPAGPRRNLARWVWTAGGAVFVVHVISSFAVYYEWSHAVALRETARQVEELTGRASGVGLYLNYLFTVVWIGDVLRAWLSRRRPAWWWALTLHGFFLFMIFNATVVFETGATRAMGLVVTLAGVAALWRASQRLRSRS